MVTIIASVAQVRESCLLWSGKLLVKFTIAQDNHMSGAVSTVY